MTSRCICPAIEASATTPRRIVKRDPLCPEHYEIVPQYGPDGENRPITERFPDDMGKHGGCG